MSCSRPQSKFWVRQATAFLSLSVLVLPGDVGAQGTSVLTLLSTEGRGLVIGGEVRGALSASDFVTAAGNYVEAWALDGEPGQEVWVDLVSADFDSYLYVVGPGLAEAITDDDSGGACHARINLTFLDRGVFTVVASSATSRETGTYQLRVAGEEPLPPAEGSCGGGDLFTAESVSPALGGAPTDGGGGSEERVLAVGRTVSGRLTGLEETRVGNDQPVQVWTLQGVAGGSATIRLESDDFDAYLFFDGPGLSELLEDDDSGGDLNSELTVSFPETGVYRAIVAAVGAGSTGSYTLSARVSGGADVATPGGGAGRFRGRLLQRGASRTGVLAAGDMTAAGRHLQIWVFQGRAGETVTFDLRSEDFDSYLYLTGPGFETPLTDDDGGAVDFDCRSRSVRSSADCTSARITVTFPTAGDFGVGVSSLGGQLGSFTLRVN